MSRHAPVLVDSHAEVTALIAAAISGSMITAAAAAVLVWLGWI